MIKNFKIFEESVNMDYLIGLPSGQIIDIHYKDVNNLKQDGLVVYHKELNSYVFSDSNYDTILIKLGKKIKSIGIEDYMMHFFDNQRNVRNFIIKGDGVEVSGSVYIGGNTEMTRFPFKFKSVSGDFIWRECNLKTLENGPEEVGGSFIVDTNGMFDLVGGPKYVGKDYICSHCTLLSLDGSPKMIRGDFDCSDNFLTNFEGGPQIVKGHFVFSENPQINSLDGLPECSNIIGNNGQVIPNPVRKLRDKGYIKKLRDDGDGKFRW